MKRILKLGFLLIIILASCSKSKHIEVCYDGNSSVVTHGVAQLKTHFNASGISIVENDLNSTNGEICILSDNKQLTRQNLKIYSENISDVTGDGFKIKREGNVIYVIGKTDKGCLYGIMDIIEQLGNSSELSVIEENQVNPAFSFRAIKFNLPWSPYRPGPANDLQIETCRDLKFWESFLDMMAVNRFNALTLWNTHPFPYMIRAKNYPKATPFNDQELEEWRQFWTSLFKMAKDRGIETYMVNWNIVVSPEFAEAYGADVQSDRSDLVKKYTKESVTQLINEYPDLTGLGVTLADWMGNWGDNLMTPKEREDWIEETFVEGMNEADRKIKFIHRNVLAGNPAEMRRVIDNADLPDKTIVEVKFNWSHGYSTPKLSITHSNDAGDVLKGLWEPKPENYFVAWMIRNEDFFVLRWGDPNFIREHLRTNKQDYVDGYFIGSEGYIPAKDYSHKDTPNKTWKYAFEKQWAFYYLWGRLLYNPEETNEELAKEFTKRYIDVDGVNLLEAYSTSSKVPQYIASFYKGTWDFTLYSEGFLAPWQVGFDDQKSPFISIEELIKHETLDQAYLNISEYCKGIHEKVPVSEGQITPMELAQNVEDDCERALNLIEKLRATENLTLESELDDLETWCHLGFYFADKIRAGVSLETYRYSKQLKNKYEALSYLTKCLGHWRNIIHLTQDRYNPMPYVSMGHHEPRWPEFTSFHWSNFLKDVEADIEFARQM